MHSFIRSVGFSKVKGVNTEDWLLDVAKEDSGLTEVVNHKDGTIEKSYYLDVANGVGVKSHTESFKKGEEFRQYYYPVLIGDQISIEEPVAFCKRVNSNSYSGMCHDIRIGISIIFFLQNYIEYANEIEHKGEAVSDKVVLTALSDKGTILLPIMSDEKDEKKRNSTNAENKRTALYAEAKKGNQEAIETLTIDDIDTFAMVSQRIKNEDLFSIVESSIVPYGSESDNYTILGIITDKKLCTNRYTNEKMWVLTLECKGIVIPVCINQDDLTGEPEVGRRFRGNVWLQGRAIFEP